MSEVKVYGLKSIKTGTPTTDGTMPTVLTELCRTYRDTAEFIEEDSEITDEFCDQEEDAFISFSTRGKKSIKVSTFDYSPTLLQKLKGGTVVNGQWAEPVTTPEIFLAVELNTDSDVPFHFPKCRVLAKFNTKLVKKGVSLLEIVFIPQSPAPGKSRLLIGKKQ